eukprot:TRINITY_DN4656_c0_g2_i1.p1 TRINITY_DN4656_c0_g2~~TRINITY_DN4656_c0_g2_i1.p1  ORF type:complete len:106 (-),score=5.95 TRINITY_DN4656_c0_g2_i1:32-349(-)
MLITVKQSIIVHGAVCEGTPPSCSEMSSWGSLRWGTHCILTASRVEVRNPELMCSRDSAAEERTREREKGHAFFLFFFLCSLFVIFFTHSQGPHNLSGNKCFTSP